MVTIQTSSAETTRRKRRDPRKRRPVSARFAQKNRRLTMLVAMKSAGASIDRSTRIAAMKDWAG
jgi:hypothetical protein